MRKNKRQPAQYAKEYVEYLNILFSSATGKAEINMKTYSTHIQDCILHLIKHSNFLKYKEVKSGIYEIEFAKAQANK